METQKNDSPGAIFPGEDGGGNTRVFNLFLNVPPADYRG